MNMTIDEFVAAKRIGNEGTVVVNVSKHKTGNSGPSQLALDAEQYKVFDIFVKRLQQNFDILIIKSSVCKKYQDIVCVEK